ncbi:unnamed protein product [Fraxinus pennsylvanica]|uniref:Transposase MuDR plant domain-containing protein n=1 Tax=Fraxinus pennsylvanica TaxID=56036 RepID=A0AAD1ZLA2_9LAMI|nr:unnamed protein product [Fraxinus pennsylvanica]
MTSLCSGIIDVAGDDAAEKLCRCCEQLLHTTLHKEASSKTDFAPKFHHFRSLLQITAQRIEAILEKPYFTLIHYPRTVKSDLNHGCKESGDAHAMEIDGQMKFKDFKLEVAEMFNCNLKIYVMNEEIVDPDVSNMPGSRSSRTTLSEAPPTDASPDMIINDMNEPELLLDPSFDVVVDTNHVEALFDVPTERPVRTKMPVPISFVGYDEKDAKAAELWLNIITGVGQRFNSVNEFREALRKYALAHQFAFKYKKNDSHRVSVKCKADGSALTTGIQATRSWVASIVKEKLKVFPNYKPKDIVKDVKEEYGVQLNYFQAWRGKEIAKEQLQGSYKEAYNREKGLKESIAEIFQNDDVYHSYCLTHLSEQFIRDLKGQFSHEVKRLMVEDFYGAAHAPTPEGFQRYNHMTSNFGELFQSWLSDAHELPIIQMVDAIRGKIMELIYTRQTESNHWQTRLTPSMEEKLEKENIKVRTLQSVHPVSNIDGPWLKGSSQLAVAVTPPPTRRPPGRPTTKKIGSQDAAKPFAGMIHCGRSNGESTSSTGNIFCQMMLIMEGV